MGPAAAVTTPSARRVSSSSPNECAVALQSMASPQNRTVTANVLTRLTLSAKIPKGRAATAPTNELTPTRSPMSMLSIWRCCRSSMAEAPTVAASALLKASTPASMTTTVVRADPPSATVSRERAALPPSGLHCRRGERFERRHGAAVFPAGRGVPSSSDEAALSRVKPRGSSPRLQPVQRVTVQADPVASPRAAAIGPAAVASITELGILRMPSSVWTVT